MLAAELIEFESRVAREFEAGRIKCPVHLSGGNELQLIQIFKGISHEDWVFSTWRSHYHALLHGIDRYEVLNEILLSHKSMNFTFPEHRFYASSIVGGILPIATGVAAALKRKGCHRKVWCFVGDMTATTGAFHEAHTYACGHDLPITFVIEDNGLSTNTPTREVWGNECGRKKLSYTYERTYPHYGIGKDGF